MYDVFDSPSALELNPEVVILTPGTPCIWYRMPEKSVLKFIKRLLTPWCRVLLEKLTGLQLVKKFHAFHGTRMFITALTSFRHLSLSWASPIQSLYPHPTSWRSILLLFSLPPSGFPTKTLYTPLLIAHTRHMPSPSHSSRFYHPHNIG